MSSSLRNSDHDFPAAEKSSHGATGNGNFGNLALVGLDFDGSPRERPGEDGAGARCLLASNALIGVTRSSVVDLQCMAVFRKVPEGYIAFIEEFPGVNTQGASLEEARSNLREAVALVIEANREMAREDADGGTVIREPITVTA